MSAPTGQAPRRFPRRRWPTETFDEPRGYMYLNGEGIEVLHQPAAHTDGDAIVFFRRSDVVVAGDVLDTTRFPVIDVAQRRQHPGRDRGAEPARGARDSVGADRLARGRHARWCPATAALRSVRRRRYRDMVTIIRDRVRDLIKDGQDARAGQGRVAGPRATRAATAPTRVRGRRTCSSRRSIRASSQEKQAMNAPAPGHGARSPRVVAGVCRRAVHGQGRGAPPPPPTAEGGGADRSHRLLGVGRHRRLALPDGDAAQGRLPGRADDARGASKSRTRGTRRPTRPPATSASRTAPRRSCACRAHPHHLAGRQHAAARDRRRHADAAFRFGRRCRSPRSRRRWQGDSAARWERPAGAARGAAPAPTRGSLKVVTTNLRAGYLRKNGVPYSENATVTEYFDRRAACRNGGQLLVVTTSSTTRAI